LCDKTLFPLGFELVADMVPVAPGYSASDVFHILNKTIDICKRIHDAPKDVKELAGELERFQDSFKQLLNVLERFKRPVEDGYTAFGSTLDECRKFIGQYEALNDPNAGRLRQAGVAVKYVFDTTWSKPVESIRAQFAHHVQNILVRLQTLSM
jgi:hypothetical protein